MKRRSFLHKGLSIAASSAALGPVSRALRAEEHRSWSALPARSLDGASITLAAADIADLAGELHGELLAPGDARYESARRVWNGSIDKHPALIAACHDAADIVRAVSFAREHQLLTAVRAGGHSTSGKSTCEGGILIDLAPMRGVSVDPKARAARMQPGTLLGEFDRECAKYGLATTLGTVSLTGAAGLTLGGGLGRLGSHFGLACDNLQAAEVVTASGQIVHTSESDNPELLWGLRGGGGNFGVLSALEYRLHPIEPLVIGGIMEWPWDAARQVIEFYADFFPNKPDPLCMDLQLRSTLNAPPTAGMSVCWSGELKAGERALEPLRKLARLGRDSVKPVPYVAVQGMFDGAFPDGRKYFQKSGLVRGLSPASIELFLDILAARRAMPLVLQLQGLGGAAGRVKPGDTAFVHRDARWDMTIITQWDDPAHSEANMQAMRDIWARLEPLTDGFYVNSRYEDSAKAFRENYGSNYPRLARLKDRYDPMNLFRLNANVAPTTA